MSEAEPANGRNRLRVGLVLGAGALHLGLTAAGVGGWPCPFRAVTGKPCPGCGMSRACLALFRGEFLSAFQFHAFAPAILLGATLFAISLLFPSPSKPYVEWWRRFDARYHLGTAFLCALLVYWLLRLVLDI